MIPGQWSDINIMYYFPQRFHVLWIQCNSEITKMVDNKHEILASEEIKIRKGIQKLIPEILKVKN